MPTGQPDLDGPSLWLLSQVIRDCVKLIIKINRHNTFKFGKYQKDEAIQIETA